eukprot:SAG31_NODE_29186_length_399_cov_1.033333_1_plen_102_part_10
MHECGRRLRAGNSLLRSDAGHFSLSCPRLRMGGLFWPWVYVQSFSSPVSWGLDERCLAARTRCVAPKGILPACVQFCLSDSTEPKIELLYRFHVLSAPWLFM